MSARCGLESRASDSLDRFAVARLVPPQCKLTPDAKPGSTLVGIQTYPVNRRQVVITILKFEQNPPSKADRSSSAASLRVTPSPHTPG